MTLDRIMTRQQTQRNKKKKKPAIIILLLRSTVVYSCCCYVLIMCTVLSVRSYDTREMTNNHPVEILQQPTPKPNHDFNVHRHHQQDDIHQNSLVSVVSPPPQPTSPVPVPRIVFVHVGKTGGTTIGSLLRITCEARGVYNPVARESCLQTLANKQQRQQQKEHASSVKKKDLVEESQLSRHVVGFIHGTQAYVRSAISSENDATPTTRAISPETLLQQQQYEDSNHSVILVSLRNPIQRIVSWFYYLHPNNCFQSHKTQDALPDKACITKRQIIRQPHGFEAQFYSKCFPTIHEFAKSLESETTISKTGAGAGGVGDDINKTTATATTGDVCQRLARAVLAGEGGPNGLAGHLWANYAFYDRMISHAESNKNNSTTTSSGGTDSNTTVKTATMTNSNKPILMVVRTEHLWHDLEQIDTTFLYGDGKIFQHQQELEKQQQQQQQQQKSTTSTSSSSSSSSSKNKKNHYYKDTLSSAKYATLCCALQSELEVYYKFVTRATNLSPLEQQETLQAVLQPCCSSNITPTTTTTATTTHRSRATILSELNKECNWRTSTAS